MDIQNFVFHTFYSACCIHTVQRDKIQFPVEWKTTTNTLNCIMAWDETVKGSQGLSQPHKLSVMMELINYKLRSTTQLKY